MTYRDVDLSFEVVGGPERYADQARGPVAGAAVLDGDQLLGYLWYGEDASEDAAGMVYRLAADQAGNAAVTWYRRLREFKASSAPPADAVRGLLGERAEYPPTGVVGRELRRWSSLTALRNEVNPPEEVADLAPASPRQAPARAERVPERRPSQADVDAALRSTPPERWSPGVRRWIEELDEGLAQRPTTGLLTVFGATTWSELGVSPASVVDSVVSLPTYLRVRFADDHELPGGGVGMRLQVPAGVPAMRLPGDHPGLLLGRGLNLHTTRLIESDCRWRLFGDLAPSTGPLVQSKGRHPTEPRNERRTAPARPSESGIRNRA